MAPPSRARGFSSAARAEPRSPLAGPGRQGALQQKREGGRSELGYWSSKRRTPLAVVSLRSGPGPASFPPLRSPPEPRGQRPAATLFPPRPAASPTWPRPSAEQSASARAAAMSRPRPLPSATWRRRGPAASAGHFAVESAAQPRLFPLPFTAAEAGSSEGGGGRPSPASQPSSPAPRSPRHPRPSQNKSPRGPGPFKVPLAAAANFRPSLLPTRPRPAPRGQLRPAPLPTSHTYPHVPLPLLFCGVAHTRTAWPLPAPPPYRPRHAPSFPSSGRRALLSLHSGARPSGRRLRRRPRGLFKSPSFRPRPPPLRASSVAAVTRPTRARRLSSPAMRPPAPFLTPSSPPDSRAPQPPSPPRSRHSQPQPRRRKLPPARPNYSLLRNNRS
ncbi:uncharacterized protein LOC134297595 [Anolis carolinensis]|uniref:uncharacterized protein LOC134297595 n=1 Tax=Anolis carolinensis TaxID=28377 RepID=UPI002F2B59B6